MAYPGLTYDHVGTNPIIISKRPSTHIHQPMSERLSTYTQPCEEPILWAERLYTYIWQPMSEGLSTYIRPCKEPILHAKRALYLHSSMRGTNPMYMSKGPCTYIWSCRNQSYSHIWMALSPRLSIPGNWPGASIPRMAFSAYIWSCRNQSYSHIRMAKHLHLTWKEPIL